MFTRMYPLTLGSNLGTTTTAMIAALTLANIRCRAWFEYVHTKQNPSDALSRGGYDDSVVIGHLARGEWQISHPSPDWDRLVHRHLDEIL